MGPMEDNLTVYRASAGSGKTFRLALEYIKLTVADGSPSAYRKVLAMTFTNKATGEMKDRILMQLYNLSRGGLDEGFASALYAELPQLRPAEVNARAGAALRGLLHDYDHFAVQTIDAFFQSMLTGLAHELGLTRNFRVDLDEQEVAGRAVDRLLLRAMERGGRGAEWVAAYMTSLIEEDKGWKVARLLKDFAGKNLFASPYLRHEEKIRPRLSDPAAWVAFTGALREVEEKHLDCVAAYGDALAAVLDEVGEENICNGNLVRAFAKRLQEGNLWAKDSKAAFPSLTVLSQVADSGKLLKKTLKKKPGIEADVQRVHEALVRADAQRRESTVPISTCRVMRSTVAQLRLLGEIGAEMEGINRETGHFMLSRTPELFRRMVGAEDASFVFERAGETFRHVMVDEFQDTSRIQWDNIRRLLLENLSSGDSCMIVGDVKQSIYRWRGGDWNILNDIAREMPRVSFAPPLVTNRRSLPAVVRFNNRLFRRAASLADANCEGVYTGHAAALYADVAQECLEGKDGGYVRVACREGKKFGTEEALADLVAQIRMLHGEKSVPYSKMAILVRRNSEAAAVVGYFSARAPDIPVVSDEAYQLAASDSVVLVVSALRWLAEEQPGDKRGEDGGADGDVEKTAGKARRRGSKALYCAAKSYAAIHGGGEPDMERVRLHARDILPAALFDERARLRRLPLYELCERLIALFGLGGEEGLQRGQQVYLYTLLDGVLEFLEDNPSDLAAFAAYWDDSLSRRSIPTDGAAEGVAVMTIHKSKGLAAHSVFIPFCGWELNRGQGDSTKWFSTDSFPAPYNFLPVYPVSSVQRSIVEASHFAAQLAAEREQERIDNLNTLYVAFTRAECNLYIWTAPGNGKGTTVTDLLAPALQTMTEPEEGAEDSGCAPDGTPYGTLTAEEVQPAETAGADGAEDGETTPYTLYVSGEPQGFTRKEERRTDNPLDIHPDELPVSLHAEGTPAVEFVQSNRASEFLAADGNGDEDGRGSYISRGNLLHRVFSAIGCAEDAPAALHDLALEGVFAGRREEEEVAALVRKCLASPEAADWFDGSWRVLTECSILTRDADGVTRQLRPDRVMTRGEETVVVDFKFGRRRAEHRDQVAGYMRLLREMGMPGVRGYLWYVYAGQTEEVTA